VAANYRVSPRVAYPSHLIDVKAAIAWVRANVATYGGDPSFIVISGGSAGGHLATLAALTPTDDLSQPELTAADTSVQACVSLYGVYDLTPDLGTPMARARLRALERFMMKKKIADDRAAFEQASPLFRVSDTAPPFFVIHGASDSLVPVAEARAFTAKLREVSRAPVVYAELSRTQHAFDVFHSIHTAYVVRAIERFCDYVYSTRTTGVPRS
jgi:acetyl esterase/lipase